MKYPNFVEEKKLWKKGYKYVVGLDEAGRGPLAGPVVAGAVAIKIFNLQFSIFNKFSIKQFPKVNDSKKLSAKQREEVYDFFKNHPDIKWGIGIVSEKVIDRINILEATKLAMEKAVECLEKKTAETNAVPKNRRSSIFWHSDYLILDGNFKINSKIPQKAIIKADQKVFSCALASIFAKVTRDKIMEKYHKKYPQYGFNRHKGYGTAHHFEMLKKHGPCKIHRKTFKPVSRIK
ncbi:MAG: ribonuclease HII [Parcubacteria group bacterium Licking1014_1]|nr:MAG: ribonuclease HII [Parcubacteria group bacterium Licking1014_1]